MADEKKAADSTQAKGSKKPLIIGAAVALLLVIGGAVAWFMFSGGEEAHDPNAQAEAAAPAPAIYASLGDKFVVTLQQGSRQRYFQVALTAMAREQPVIDELSVHAPLIRGRLISLLGAQDFTTLGTEEGKIALRAQILSTIQQILSEETGSPGIEQVFFTEFVLQ